MEKIWEDVKTIVKEKMPAHSFKMWIQPLICERQENDDSLVLSAPNSFSKKRVSDFYFSLLEEEIQRVLGRKCKLKIDIWKNGKKKPRDELKVDPQLPLPAMNLLPCAGRMLRRDFTFDNFVVSMSNDYAYSAALSMANRDQAYQNALYLLSGTGMGKSHLSQAVGHHILSRSPGDKVFYITAEDFTNDMVKAFRQNSIDRFKEKYRTGCDVLLLEDIHFLTNKNRTQAELAQILDYLLDAKKKILFSSCYQPSEIPKISDQLRSRLSSGLVLPIDAPDFKTRVRILKRKAREKGYRVCDEVIEYLAGELTSDIRQLESGMVGVVAKSSLLGVRIDLDLAQGVVKTMVNNHKKITLEAIKQLVCKEYRISEEEIVSKSRRQNIVKPRQIAIYLARRYTDCPLQAIGKSFNRYHATALHSIGAVEKDMKKSTAVKEQVKILSKKIESGNF